MKLLLKIARTLRRFAENLIDLIIRALLVVSYFIFITPFGMFFRLFRDHLGIKAEPRWKDAAEVDNVSDFLKGQ